MRISNRCTRIKSLLPSGPCALLFASIWALITFTSAVDGFSISRTQFPSGTSSQNTNRSSRLSLAQRHNTPPPIFDADKEAATKKRYARQTTNTNSRANRDDPEWKFFDTARINVQGGDGGNGCVAFRREKGEARGGPNGGRGGRGGSVFLVCDPTLNTLMPLRQRVHVRAKKGLNGLGKNKDGSQGQDIYIRAPPGTVVRELHTQKLAGELREEGDELLVAKGGRGGRGNRAFMTARRTAPKLAERGEPGAARWLSIELRLVADVGFLGKPNAGKSFRNSGCSYLGVAWSHSILFAFACFKVNLHYWQLPVRPSRKLPITPLQPLCPIWEFVI